MRYMSIYNEESNKYYILDTLADKKISDNEYDKIIQLFQDTYAVVGNIESSRDNPFSETLYFRYGLIDMSGNEILRVSYRFIYIHENRILCQYLNGKVLEKTLLGQTIWRNRKGEFYISGQLIDYDDEHAIIQHSLPVDNSHKFKIYQNYHELIDVYGKVLDRDYSFKPQVKLPKNKQYSAELLTDYHTCKFGYNGRVNMKNNKWLNIFNSLESICEDNIFYFNLTLPNGLRFEKFHFEVFNDMFFLVKQRGYYSRYLCVLDDNMNVLHYDSNGFTAERIGRHYDLPYIHISYQNSYIKTHSPQWICNDECDSGERPFFLKINGDKFFLPSKVSIHAHELHNKFVPIYNENKFGYINLHGEIVVPPIFELEKERFLDVDPKDVDFHCDNEDYSHYSKLDAVDGDEDALWNID